MVKNVFKQINPLSFKEDNPLQRNYFKRKKLINFKSQ